jgi:4-hydroxy-2-oxoglutarate aldolase
MVQNKRKLSGVVAPVVTPFCSDELALDDLRFNLRKLNETGLAGYFALGSNGEFRSLTDREQIQVLEVFAEEKGEKVVMVGTACESTTMPRALQAAYRYRRKPSSNTLSTQTLWG